MDGRCYGMLQPTSRDDSTLTKEREDLDGNDQQNGTGSRVIVEMGRLIMSVQRALAQMRSGSASWHGEEHGPIDLDAGGAYKEREVNIDMISTDTVAVQVLG